LDASLEVTAVSALLRGAALERIDTTAPPVDLPHTENSARLSVKLEPDAEYRLLARAEPTSRITLPWQQATPDVLSVERVFSTVRAPAVVEPDERLVVFRDQPLEVRFSEPLARMSVAAPGLSVRGRIAAGDPQLIQIDVADPPAGATFALHLTDVVGQNGAEAPRQIVEVQTPDPIELVGVGGARPTGRVAVPHDIAISLTWSVPVTRVDYRVGGLAAAWDGPPAAEVALPVRLSQGESASLVIEDAQADTGAWLDGRITVDLFVPDALQVTALWPADGAAGVPPRADPTLRFSEPIADRAAAEAAILFDPPVPGDFEWLAPNRVRFLPETPFPSETSITIHLAHGLAGVRGQSGSYFAEPVRAEFTTGKLKMIDVSLSQQRITLYEEDEVVWSAPVATGVRGAETPPGTYEVLYKMPTARFRGVNPDGSRYDISNVRWVLAFYGDYTIHGAWWRNVFGRPGSAVCTDRAAFAPSRP